LIIESGTVAEISVPVRQLHALAGGQARQRHALLAGNQNPIIGAGIHMGAA